MKQSADDSQSDTRQRAELRREPRRAAAGEVRFSFREPGSKAAPRRVQGRLIDRSSGGFRAQHDCPELSTGQVVQFQLADVPKGKARVVWTRILGEGVETGFLIVP
jgi:hypothetical protein